MGKKILIHSIVFSPDGVSTAYLYNDIACGLRDAGNDVVVLTTTPHYNIVESSDSTQILQKKYFGLYYKSIFNGITVYHVNLKKFKNTFIRILSFIYWHIMSFIIALRINNLDLILTPSPPLSIGFLSVIISKIKGAKCIYNVQEIYPDFLIKHGNLRNKFVIQFLKWMESFIYNNCQYVTTIDQLFYNIISPRFYTKEQLKVIPNFVDTDLYKPMQVELDFLKSYNINSEALKLMYAGNIGHAQDWLPILETAKYFNTTGKIQFIIIGEGVKKELIINEIKLNNLDNILLLPYQNRNNIPIFNSLADIHFICMNESMEEEGFPSKIYTIMSCGKPSIVTSGFNTPLHSFLADKDCAILISDNRIENFKKEIIALVNDKNKLLNLGANARQTILNSYSKEKVVSKYVELVNTINE